jgi:hypothetical protein
MKHVAVGGNLVDGIVLAVRGTVMAESVVTCGRYWLVLDLSTTSASIATGLARLTGTLTGCYSLPSSGCRRRFPRFSRILKMKDISGKAKHERLKAFDASVDVLVMKCRCLREVMAIGTMLARIGTVETVITDASWAELAVTA